MLDGIEWENKGKEGEGNRGGQTLGLQRRFGHPDTPEGRSRRRFIILNWELFVKRGFSDSRGQRLLGRCPSKSRNGIRQPGTFLLLQIRGAAPPPPPAKSNDRARELSSRYLPRKNKSIYCCRAAHNATLVFEDNTPLPRRRWGSHRGRMTCPTQPQCFYENLYTPVV